MTTETHLAVGALRERMIEDMRVRGFVEKTRKDYVRHLCGNSRSCRLRERRRFFGLLPLAWSDDHLSSGRRLGLPFHRLQDPGCLTCKIDVLVGRLL
jgi:hypothetical protein